MKLYFCYMWRSLMEIMLMAKFMEIVSSVVIYMCVCVCVYFIYLSIYTLPTIDSQGSQCLYKKLRVDFVFFFFSLNSRQIIVAILKSFEFVSCSDIRLECIQKSPISLKSTVAILMSFTCKDIYKFINQRYNNHVRYMGIK